MNGELVVEYKSTFWLDVPLRLKFVTVVVVPAVNVMRRVLAVEAIVLNVFAPVTVSPSALATSLYNT